MYGLSKGAVLAAVAAALCFGSTSVMAQEFSNVGGLLKIRGTTGSDQLTLTGGALGEVVVTDGQGNEIDTFTEVDVIDIDLRGGEDILTLADITLDGGVIDARLGADGDDVFVTGIITADLILDGETDADLLDLSGGVTVTGNLEVYGGIRNDDILLTGAVVDGNLWVDAQAGDDELNYDGLSVSGFTRLDLGAGDDLAVGASAIFSNDVDLIAGLGDDDVFHSVNIYAGNLFVDLRGGADDYEEIGSSITGDFHVDGGAGNDDFDDTGTVVLGSRTVVSI